MTDKVQKILSEIATRKLCTMDEHMAFYNDTAKEDYRFLSEIEELIKALQEEPVSKDTKESVLYNDMKPWEVPEYIIEAINKKRVCPTLKGEVLHKFKNEFNTLKQTLHLLYNLDTSVNYRLALHWASWGAQNLQGCFGISEEKKAKMDTEEPVSEDLMDATNNYCVNVRKGYPRVMDETDRYICNAFKAGAKWQKEKMIAKAIDGKVVAMFPLASEPLYADAEIYLKYTKNLKEGDKVKVIVIKEN